ncbi:MAG TPA: FtsX-like permease family protein [Actinomycetota bacterium]|nr:FtsX-like permease family protein [Actinomycetota bacterium]
MRHNKARSALTALGIVLGVAILFGVLVSSATTNSGVDRLFQDLTGRADVLVSAAGTNDATMPAVAVVGLARLPDVEAAVGGYGFSSSVSTGEATETVGVRGVVLEQERLIHDHVLEPDGGRRFAEGAPEVVMPRRLVDRLGLGLGEKVTLTTPSGPTEVTLVGVLTDTGAGRRNEGRVLYTSLPVAQAMGGVGDRLSGVALVLAKGTDVGSWVAEHEGDLGPGYEFVDADSVGAGFKDFLRVLQSFFTFFAALALFVGAFLIYLTLSMAVVERRRIHGTMRALGATRGQVARVVLAEAATLGAASTLAGLVLGLAAARGLLALIGELFDIEPAGLTVTVGAVVVSSALGMGVTLLSSVVPALRAGRLSPVVAMRGEVAFEGAAGRSWMAGLVLVGVGLLVRAGGATGALLTGASTIAILAGSVLLVPALVRPLAALVGRLTGRLGPGVGEIAVLHLVKERSRSAYTLGLIMVVMAMLLAVGGVNASVTNAIAGVVDRQFGADLRIGAPGPVDPTVEERLRGVAGVGAVSAVRFGRVRAVGHEERALLTVVDPQTYFSVSSFSWADGDDAAAREALSTGGAVLVSDRLARDLGLSRGDPLTLETAAGPVAFAIAGSYVSFEGVPSVTIGLGDGRRSFGADRPAAFLAALAPGADPDEVVGAVRREVADPFGLTVTTAVEQKAEMTTEIRRYFRIVYAILLFAALVGLLGLANTLAMSVLRRWREIGVLRAIGVTREQVARMVLVEAATLGVVAFLLAIPLGSLLSVLVVRDTAGSFGLNIPYLYPVRWLPVLALFGIGISVLAAVAPGRRASRMEVVQALEHT